MLTGSEVKFSVQLATHMPQPVLVFHVLKSKKSVGHCLIMGTRGKSPSLPAMLFVGNATQGNNVTVMSSPWMIALSGAEKLKLFHWLSSSKNSAVRGHLPPNH